jgi:NADH-quinone oxidoreductase subunit I
VRKELGRGLLGDLADLGSAVGRAMKVTLVNLFRKPVTVHYPDVTRAYPDRYRGLLALTYDPQTGEENCIGCRLCEYICPPQVIKVEMLKAEKRNFAKTFTLELYACEFCELCVQVCPTDAIVMTRSFDLPTADRREMLLDKDRLHALGIQFQPSWATGNLLRDMQAPPKAPREAAHAAPAADKASAGAPAAAAPAAPAPKDTPA